MASIFAMLAEYFEIFPKNSLYLFTQSMMQRNIMYNIAKYNVVRVSVIDLFWFEIC